MSIEKLNDNLYLLRFPELFNTTCALVETVSSLFVVDTFTGPGAMSEWVELIRARPTEKRLYVINTHSHFDHIWGNCAFRNARFISHVRCRLRMQEDSAAMLEKIQHTNPGWVRGAVKIVLPDLVFTDRLFFYDEGISLELLHMPGHSADSIVVWLEPYGICLAGDAVEDPIPLLQEAQSDSNIDLYIKNLRRLKKRKPAMVIPGHGNRRDPGLINENIAYLANLRKYVKKSLGEPDPRIPGQFTMDNLTDFYRDAHAENITQTVKYLRKRAR